MPKQFIKLYYDLFDLDLSPCEVVVLCYVMQYDEKGCKATNKYIGQKLNISLKTTQTIVQKMVKNGLIVEKYESGHRVMYFDSANYSKLRVKMLLESVKKKKQ